MHKNENRPGYKKTKVGWIPEGWNKHKISEISKINVGKDLREEAFSRTKTESHIFPVYSNTVSDEGLYGYYNFEEYDGNSLTVVGRGVGLGTAFSRNSGFGAIGRLLVIAPTKTRLFDVRYFAEYVNSRLRIHHESGGIPQLPGESFGNYEIILPPLPEQEAIADVLKCWDKGIQTLEKKIVKKRLIKKGLMQKLLSGQTRLPGFSKPWKNVRLGDLGEFKTSSVDKKNEPDQEEAYLVNYMDVYRNRFITKAINFQKITATQTEIEKSQIQKGDILFTPSSETPDDIGHSAVVTEDLPKVLQSYHVVRLRIKNDDDLDFNFRGYVFNNADILNTFAHLSTGATRYTLSLGDFKNTQAYIPSDPKEQRAIAEVLSAADGENEALEKKLALWKDQKKFLLNNLVTGTIRLPEFRK